MTVQDNAFIGTELKYLLEISASGFDMDRDDFEITLKRGSKSLNLKKSDLVVEDYTVVEDNISITKHHYYVCFDSAYFGSGIIAAIITAYVPDEDFDDGFRTEVDKFDLVNVKNV